MLRFLNLKKKALQNFILMPVTFWFSFIMIFYHLNTLSEMFHEVLHSSLACICSLTYINHIVAGDLVNDYTEMIELITKNVCLGVKKTEYDLCKNGSIICEILV